MNQLTAAVPRFSNPLQLSVLERTCKKQSQINILLSPWGPWLALRLFFGYDSMFFNEGMPCGHSQVTHRVNFLKVGQQLLRNMNIVWTCCLF